MADKLQLPAPLIKQLGDAPTPNVVIELTAAGRKAKILHLKEFKRLIAYLLEKADGRDRREPFADRRQVERPTPKLRAMIDTCFGIYGNLQWFNINKITNRSGQPLVGMFPRMAASMGRVQGEDFAACVTAIQSPSPDGAVLRLLNEHGGKIKGMGVELFARLACVYQPGLYFAIPREWGTASGCLEYIDNDLRKYLAVCQNLREVCDSLHVPTAIRGPVFHHLLLQKKQPKELHNALNKAIGPALARFTGVDASAGFTFNDKESEDRAAMPMEFAQASILQRRGPEDLRRLLCNDANDTCAISGPMPRDLLEVAYISPYPTSDVHTPQNALLLRSDLHTLWDLNLIGIEPSTMRVHIAPALTASKYGQLAARPVFQREKGFPPSVEALRERWRLFRAAHKEQGDEVAPKATPTAAPNATVQSSASEMKPDAPEVVVNRDVAVPPPPSASSTPTPPRSDGSQAANWKSGEWKSIKPGS
jgi:hypothetical protein